MAFKLEGKPLAVDVAFTHNDIQYPANWLRLSTAEEKTAIGITEVADAPTYDSRFYLGDGTAKSITDINEVYIKDAEDGSYKAGDPILDENGDQIVNPGVKSVLKAQEKEIAKSLLNIYDWQVIRKAEKGTAIDSNVTTFRDGIRTAYTTRKTEIDNCADTAALVTLYGIKEDGTPNMTQYPTDPNS
tara:strand:+ start:3302 stop:3862 length:561 start_codon:yes stop_codon:yes gene_type:complete